MRGMNALQVLVGMMHSECIVDMIFSTVQFSLSSFWYGTVGTLCMCSLPMSHTSKLYSSSANGSATTQDS